MAANLNYMLKKPVESELTIDLKDGRRLRYKTDTSLVNRPSILPGFFSFRCISTEAYHFLNLDEIKSIVFKQINNIDKELANE